MTRSPSANIKITRTAARFVFRASVGLIAWTLFEQLSIAQYAWFQRPTDSIKVSGQTERLGRLSTYEARFLIPNGVEHGGYIYLERTPGTLDPQNNQPRLERKMLFAGPRRIFGSNVRAPGNTAWKGVVFHDSRITPGVWHHVAFVTDQNEDRLYLDGRLVNSMYRTASVNDGAGQGYLGASLQSPPLGGGLQSVHSGFVGILDYVRLSSTNRYRGDKFEPPAQDLVSDSETVLLYNFNESAGSSIIHDESPLKRHGIPGGHDPNGFEGATSPVLTNSPAPGPSTGWFVSINPRGSYLKVQSDAPFDAIPIQLDQFGIRPGDILRLVRVGDFNEDIQSGEDALVAYELTAVFSGTSKLGLWSDRFRVLDAIDVSEVGVDVDTFPARTDNDPNDIPEDFKIPGGGVIIKVPTGARYLFACGYEPSRGHFATNLDMNGYYGLYLERISDAPDRLKLSIQPTGDSFQLLWDFGRLQRSVSLGNEEWHDFPDATSPLNINLEMEQEFFRLQQ